MENGNSYGFDYFERGIGTGRSCYENYRWIPELTIPMAMSIIDYLEIRRNQTILDYGCAKGYLVKALRMLHRQAWGVDISEYAMEHIDPCTRLYVAKIDSSFGMAIPLELDMKMPKVFDYCISKDVFEHIPLNHLQNVLRNIPASKMMVIVPLGDGDKYNIPAMHLDVTHIHMEPMQWWVNLFDSFGWDVAKTSTRMHGIKDHWVDFENGHGFFILHSRVWTSTWRR